MKQHNALIILPPMVVLIINQNSHAPPPGFNFVITKRATEVVTSRGNNVLAPN